jgi:hypothetical protein
MSVQFDPYQKWLNVPSGHEASHYELLGLRAFESDPSRIKQAYERTSAVVHQWEASKYAETATRILQELTQAYLCLCDAQKKAEYDHRLRNAATVTDVPTTTQTHSDDRSPESSQFLDAAPSRATNSGRLVPAQPPWQRTELAFPFPRFVAAVPVFFAVVAIVGAVLITRPSKPPQTMEIADTTGVAAVSENATPDLPDVETDGPVLGVPTEDPNQEEEAEGPFTPEPVSPLHVPLVDIIPENLPPDADEPAPEPTEIPASLPNVFPDPFDVPLPKPDTVSREPETKSEAAERGEMQRAQQLISSGDFEQAKRLLQSLEAETASQATFYLGLIAALVDGDHNEARRQFLRLRQTDPPLEVACLNNLAVIAAPQDPQEAARQWQAALRAGSAPEVTQNIHRFLWQAKSGRVRIAATTLKRLESQLDANDSIPSIAPLDRLVYMDFVHSDGSTPSWRWPGLVAPEDIWACARCDDSGSMRCPNSRCRQGSIRGMQRRVVGSIPAPGGGRTVIHGNFPVTMRCPICGGTGQVRCTNCSETRSRFGR